MEKKLHFLKISYKLRLDTITKIVIMMSFMLFPSYLLYSQDINTKFNLSVKNEPLKAVLEKMKKQSKLNFVYSDDEIKNHRVTVTVSSLPLDKTMNMVLNDLPFTYEVRNSQIVIISPKAAVKSQSETNFTIQGKVMDSAKEPIPGATILIEGTTRGAICSNDGSFKVIAKRGETMEISAVGFKSMKYTAQKAEDNLVFKLEDDNLQVDDVVITGIYTRNKESFTGSSATYSQKDLKLVGSTNLLQSLKTLDPTFVMLDSKKFGSDPNRLPDMEIRGITSVAGLKTEFGEDPNRPLFVLDGVECSLQDVVNLNMDRVESITILKDAASTAIYGSKAANGVVVVETVQPKAGKLRLSYNGNFVLTMPDLSDYNLMNAAEKLEFELRSGYYDSPGVDPNMYNENLKEILRGVDTYWLSQPLRTVLNNTHNIYVDGGEGAMRYGIGVNYNGNNGVMKQSARDVIGANLQLSYRTSKLIFTNRFNTNITTSTREPVPYSIYAKQNPYFRMNDSEGNYSKYLYVSANGNVKELNPCYIAQFPNDMSNNTTAFSNNFSVVWNILKELKLDASFNINSNVSKDEDFKSPKHPDFESGDALKSGYFSYNSSNALNYNGRFVASYGKLFGNNHQINAVLGGDFSHSNTNSTGYTVNGFASDLHQNPQYSSGFTEGQTPTYSINKSRTANFYFNGNYSYKNRYLMDVNYRMSGTSRFGSNKLFSKTWSVGLAWNVHNEAFIQKNAKWINNLKIRGSIGNPGNQNFDAYIAYKTYTYNSNYQNMFGTSALIQNYGNKDLEWQVTIDRNIGLDLTILNNKLNLYIDYYNKKTDPMLLDVGVPISTGTSTLKTNLGGTRSTGVNGRINYMIIRKQGLTWNLNATYRLGKVNYFGFGDALFKLNAEASSSTNNTNEKNILKAIYDTDSFKRYYDGGDPNDLYAVRSLGIDPATGREVFIDRYGKPTFEYSNNAQVKVGNSRPDIGGVVGTNLNYKNITFNISFGYSFGATQMASALYQKVENIKPADLKYNQDKRALYDRWYQPGDIAKFSSIDIQKYSDENFPMSSRFLVTEDYISIESVSLSYDFTGKWLKTLGLTGANLNMYLNNIARITSFKEERGIDYPFARTITLAIGLRF